MSWTHSAVSSYERITMVKNLAVKFLRAYKRYVSGLLPPACRFTPTCSEYAAEAVQRYGVVTGAWLAVKRLLRCHPFHPGGFDPVP